MSRRGCYIATSGRDGTRPDRISQLTHFDCLEILHCGHGRALHIMRREVGPGPIGPRNARSPLLRAPIRCRRAQ
jgi:hypothetical protein